MKSLFFILAFMLIGNLTFASDSVKEIKNKKEVIQLTKIESAIDTVQFIEMKMEGPKCYYR